MGNVASACLMYALQVVWYCQRMIDKDFSQNYGSRQESITVKPQVPIDVVFLEKHSSSTPILSRSPHRRSVLKTKAKTSSLPNYYNKNKTEFSRPQLLYTGTRQRTCSLRNRRQTLQDRYHSDDNSNLISCSSESTPDSSTERLQIMENVENGNTEFGTNNIQEWVNMCSKPEMPLKADGEKQTFSKGSSRKTSLNKYNPVLTHHFSDDPVFV